MKLLDCSTQSRFVKFLYQRMRECVYILETIVFFSELFSAKPNNLKGLYLARICIVLWRIRNSCYVNPDSNSQWNWWTNSFAICHTITHATLSVMPQGCKEGDLEEGKYCLENILLGYRSLLIKLLAKKVLFLILEVDIFEQILWDFFLKLVLG